MTKNSKRRPTIGEDPLDAVLGGTSGKMTSTRSQSPVRPAAERKKEPGRKDRKLRYTFHVSEALVEECRDAVFWTPGETLAAMCDRGLRRELAALEKKNGGPFKKRKADLKGGRPIGS